MIDFNLKKLSSSWFRTIGRATTVGLLLCGLSSTFLVARSINSSFLKTTDRYDYVLTASTKDAKVTLDSLYYIGTPNSNLGVSYYNGLKDIKTLDAVVPLKQVDEYSGLQVIGTIREFFNDYSIKDGRLFSDKSNEIVIGCNVAESKNLMVGSKIKLTHRTINTHGIVGDKVAGPDDGKDYEHTEEYKVVGVLSETQSVHDNLLYMDINDTHSLHNNGVVEESKDATEEAPSIKADILNDIDTTTINSILIKTGGSVGLTDLQKYIHNDTAVSLYKLVDSLSYVQELRSNIEKVFPFAVSLMFILLSLILSLVVLSWIKSLKEDIKAMFSIRVPKSDIIVYTILDSVIEIGLGVLLSFPINHLFVRFLNSLLSEWSLIISMDNLPMIILLALPAILAYICIISYIFISGVLEEN